MSFSGTVEKESYEGGLMVAFEGRAPRLGATLRVIGGKPIGRVNTVIGAVDRALIHIHPLAEGIEASSAVGSPVEIAPRERRERSDRGRGGYDRRDNSRGRDGGGFQRRDGRSNDRGNNRGGNRGGDWDCPKCNNNNFSFRDKCNRCEAERPSGGGNSRGGDRGGYRGGDKRDNRGGNRRDNRGGDRGGNRGGDWDCPKCKNNNFAFRNKCNRCEAERPSGGGNSRGGDRGGYRGGDRRDNRGGDRRDNRGGDRGGNSGGDWDCPKCKNNNFAFRDKCNRCQANRPSGGGSSGGGNRGGSRDGGNRSGNNRGGYRGRDSGGSDRRGPKSSDSRDGGGRGRAPGSSSRPRRSGFRGTGRGGFRGNRPGRGSGRR